MPLRSHHCAGDRATVELIKTAAGLLCTAMEYAVVTLDLGVPLTTIPALPADGFVIRHVRPVP